MVVTQPTNCVPAATHSCRTSVYIESLGQYCFVKGETFSQVFHGHLVECISTDIDSNNARVLKEAGDIINELFHSEITNDRLGCDLPQLNINQCINQTNPILWKFLECATRKR